jgi:serine 3-dehydrogenase
MNRLSGKRVMITGATSGIGLESAKLFAESGCKLILNGRRIQRLNELKEELESLHQSIEIDLMPLDVRDEKTIEEFFSSYQKPIDILLNNAGLALSTDPVHNGNPEEWRTMIETNVLSLLHLTQHVGRRMLEQNSGHIINLGSLAGVETYPGGTVYTATKHAVRAITMGTKKDFHGTPIRVSAVSPGLVETEFSVVRFRGDQKKADRVYQGMDPLTALDIAEIVHFVANRPSHVDIMDVLVLPVDQSSSQMVHRRS